MTLIKLEANTLDKTLRVFAEFLVVTLIQVMAEIPRKPVVELVADVDVRLVPGAFPGVSAFIPDSSVAPSNSTFTSGNLVISDSPFDTD